MGQRFKDLGEGVHRDLETGRILVEEGKEEKEDKALQPRVIGTINLSNLK